MYVQGFVVPVPEGNKAVYLAMAEAVNAIFAEHGAVEIVEAWEEEVAEGKLTDFRRAVDARPGERIVFSWIIWPDRATCDEAHEKIWRDERMNEPAANMPFDGRRMIFGGFSPIYTLGADGRQT